MNEIFVFVILNATAFGLVIWLVADALRGVDGLKRRVKALEAAIATRWGAQS